jgi:dephospho-CoA kinase
VSKRWPGKKVIGLTGNIATGKSVVRRMLEHLGAFGIDADGLVHRAMSPGAPAYLPVVETFGKWVLTPAGQVNRQRLGKIVFADPEAMAALERITHPIIVQVIDLLIRRAKQEVIVIEAIKLLEAGLGEHCDEVWVVDAPQDVRLQRLMKARTLPEAEARLRMNAQSPQADKLKQAAVVIDNGNGHEKTWDEVQRAYNRLMGIVEVPPEPEVQPEPVVVAPPQPEAVPQPSPEAVAVVEAPPAPAVLEPVALSPGDISVSRGGPHQAGEIAEFINRMEGAGLTRTDVLVRFGQKAYMLVRGANQIVGLAGWQVENLIARVDEFMLRPGVPEDAAVKALANTIEQAAFDLQSEIILIFLKESAPGPVYDAMLAAGYEIKTMADLRVPDWREAAEESAPPDSTMFFKRIREDRVLKPI